MRKSSRFVVTDLSELVEEYGVEGEEFDSSNSSRIVCKCQYCLEAGEPNMKTTLYVYPDTMSFYCFRCRTAGIDSSIKLDTTSYKIKQLERRITSDKKIVFEFQPINLDHLNYIRNDEYIQYFLKTRSYKYIPKLDEWGFREIRFMGRKGFIIPFIYEGSIINYQIRFIDNSNKKMKYYTSEGLKIPFFLGGYNSSNSYDTITLVEGVFDATAASFYNLPNPIALLGSAVPSDIYYIITRVVRPKKIIYAFDDMEINLKLSELFKKYLHEIYYINTFGDDLDEYLKSDKKVKISNHHDYIQSRRDSNLMKKIGSWVNKNGS